MRNPITCMSRYLLPAVWILNPPQDRPIMPMMLVRPHSRPPPCVIEYISSADPTDREVPSMSPSELSFLSPAQRTMLSIDTARQICRNRVRIPSFHITCGERVNPCKSSSYIPSAERLFHVHIFTRQFSPRSRESLSQASTSSPDP
jgi:hypothetical protein